MWFDSIRLFLGGRGRLVAERLHVTGAPTTGILFTPSPTDRDAGVGKLADLVVGDRRGLRVTDEYAYAAHVFHAAVVDVVVYHGVVLDDLARIVGMVIVLEHVAHLDGCARDVVELTTRDDVALRAELEIHAGAAQSGEFTLFEAEPFRRVADDVCRALEMLVMHRRDDAVA